MPSHLQVRLGRVSLRPWIPGRGHGIVVPQGERSHGSGCFSSSMTFCPLVDLAVIKPRPPHLSA